MKIPALMLLLLASAPATAASCTDIENADSRLACYDSTRNCTGIEDDSSRLACFDQGFARWAAANGQDEVAIHEAPGESLSRAEKDDRDFPVPSAQRENIPQIDARIVAVQKGAYGIDYLTLDNDQVWRETQDSRVRFKVGQTVNIQPGILGSHNLRVSGVKRLVKVRRIK